MAKISGGVNHGNLQEGGPKMAKIEYGVKPDIFKYATTWKRGWFKLKTAPLLVQTRQPLRGEETPPCLHANQEVCEKWARNTMSPLV